MLILRSSEILKTYCEIILVCCILHNFCRDLPVHCDDDDDDDDDNDNDVSGRIQNLQFSFVKKWPGAHIFQTI